MNLLVLAWFAGPVHAQQETATVQITVAPLSIRSLTVELVGGATVYSFGTADMDTLIMGATPFLVTNTGNIMTTFTLQITTETDTEPLSFPWTSTDDALADISAVIDRYKLFAKFDSTATAAPSFVGSETALFIVKKGSAQAAQTLGGQFAGSMSGADVHATNSVGLWFAIHTSKYTTTDSAKRFVVTVAAL